MALLGLAFFLSGAAALVYQVVWQRILTLHTGIGVVLRGPHRGRVHGGPRPRQPARGRPERTRLAPPGAAALRPAGARGGPLRRDQLPPLLRAASGPWRPASTGRPPARRRRTSPPSCCPRRSWACRCPSSCAPRSGRPPRPHESSARSTVSTCSGRPRARFSRPGSSSASSGWRGRHSSAPAPTSSPPPRPSRWAAAPAPARPARDPPRRARPRRGRPRGFIRAVDAALRPLRLPRPVARGRLVPADGGRGEEHGLHLRDGPLHLPPRPRCRLPRGRPPGRAPRPPAPGLPRLPAAPPRHRRRRRGRSSPGCPRARPSTAGSSTTGGRTPSSSSARTGTPAPSPASTASCPLALYGAPTVLMGLSFGALQRAVQDDPATSGRKVGSSRPRTSPAARRGAWSPASSSSSGSAPPAPCGCSSPWARSSSSRSAAARPASRAARRPRRGGPARPRRAARRTTASGSASTE